MSRRLFGPLFPGWPTEDVPVGHVTNGVHVPTWHSETARGLWTEAAGGDRAWMKQPSLANGGLERMTDERLWAYRAEARHSLVEYVRDRVQRQFRQRDAGPDEVARARHVLDPNVLTLGFARRFAGYKRPNLILHDPERLVRILLDAARPCQIVFAGKAHPDDQGGKAMVQRLAQFAFRDDVRSHVVFLEDYDMVLAQHLAAGVDVWINNPRRPAEACGTSGMKMLVNGGLNLSTLDGWWDEAYDPEVGWVVGDHREHDGDGDDDDARSLYDQLEHAIVPEFYERDTAEIPRRWVRRVRASMTRLTEPFSSDRMVRDYAEGSYVPAAQAFAARAADGGRLASRLEAWASSLAEDWSTMRFGRLGFAHAGGDWWMDVHVFLGNVRPESIRLELYSDAADGRPRIVTVMEPQGPISGTVNGHVYGARVPADRPAEHYTPRVVPWHEDALVPADCNLIAWWDSAAGRVQVQSEETRPAVDDDPGADLPADPGLRVAV